MGRRLRPRIWVLLSSCSTKCSVNEANIGPERAKLVHGWYEQGLNDKQISKNALDAGFALSHGALGRHRMNHLEPKGETHGPRMARRLTDLEIIEEMIQAGGERAGDFKMTPSETMKAMELKYKLTQGSAFESMLDALNRAGMEEEEEWADEEETEEDLERAAE